MGEESKRSHARKLACVGLRTRSHRGSVSINTLQSAHRLNFKSIGDDRWPSMIAGSEENSLSSPTVTERSRAFAHLSGDSRVENSGNTYTLINNYFNDSSVLPKTSFGEYYSNKVSLSQYESTITSRTGSGSPQLTANKLETRSAPVTASTSIGGSVTEPSRSSLSSVSSRPTPQVRYLLKKYASSDCCLACRKWDG